MSLNGKSLKRLLAGLRLVAALGGGLCQAADNRMGIQSHPWLGLDLSYFDETGLYGPPDGLRALDYEFCIPAGLNYREEVTDIDPSAGFLSDSPGRIGCGLDELLVLGNTHQPGFREVLARLIALPYVERIVPAWFE